MKQIKTIIKRRDNSAEFDILVNNAIQEGWVLIRRYLDQGFDGGSMVFYPALIAEMEMETSDESDGAAESQCHAT